MTRCQLPVLLLFAVLLLRGWWHRQPPAGPAPLPVAEAELWMLRALPGIGPSTAPDRLAELHAGDLSHFPDEAAALARQLFALP